VLEPFTVEETAEYMGAMMLRDIGAQIGYLGAVG
jgi:hypothetical protein